MSSRLLKDFLNKLGLNDREVEIYLVLNKRGMLTYSELAKRTKIPRTSIYRLAEEMKRKGVINEVVDHKRVKLETASVEKLKFLVNQKINQDEYLKQLLPKIEPLLVLQQQLNQPTTKVVFYKGIEGVRQMVWNVLRAKKEVVGYTDAYLANILGDKFISQWRKEFILKGLRFRDIINESYLENRKAKNEISVYKSNHFYTRWLPDEKLKIVHLLDIYDDVIQFYDWHEEEIFGVQIYNKKVADFQKQIFNILWETARPVT